MHSRQRYLCVCWIPGGKCSLILALKSSRFSPSYSSYPQACQSFAPLLSLMLFLPGALIPVISLVLNHITIAIISRVLNLDSWHQFVSWVNYLKPWCQVSWGILILIADVVFCPLAWCLLTNLSGCVGLSLLANKCPLSYGALPLLLFWRYRCSNFAPLILLLVLAGVGWRLRCWLLEVGEQPADFAGCFFSEG